MRATRKKLSIKRTPLRVASFRICTDDMLDSINSSRAAPDLRGTTNPDDWARISGKKETIAETRIVYVRTIVNEGDRDKGGRQIERVTTGQYL